MYPLLGQTATCHYGIIYAYMHKKNLKPEFGATTPKHYVGEPNAVEREEAAKEVKVAAAKPKAKPVEQATFRDESPVVEEPPAEEDAVPYKM
jgi:hypothetical protein